MPPPYPPASVAFGNALLAQFNLAYPAPIFPDELGKMDALEAAILGLGGAWCKVEIYHGTVSQVSFAAQPPYTRAAPQCELSDIAIVAFSSSEIRLAFLQLKDTKAGKGPSPIKLGNAEQYAVLGRRPAINAWHGTATWSNDVLLNAILPSIGCFGVYFENAGAVDFRYCAADLLTIATGPVIGKYVRADMNMPPPVPILVRNSLGKDEVSSCQGLSQFGAALHFLEIGTPIHPNVDPVSPISPNGQPATANARQALAATLAAIANPGPVSVILRGLLGVRRPDIGGGNFGARRLIVINVNQ